MNAYKVVVPDDLIDVVLGETPTEAVENWFQVNKERIRQCVEADNE
jgi:hypothetical protein